MEIKAFDYENLYHYQEPTTKGFDKLIKSMWLAVGARTSLRVAWGVGATPLPTCMGDRHVNVSD